MSLKSLYISYDGILEPIGKSQVISYLIELSKKRISFVVISFEKPEKLNEKKKVDITKKILAENDIKWMPLKYHKRFRIIATAWDILMGVFSGIWIYRKFQFEVIHSRSFIASVIASIIKYVVKSFFIYDVRGFWSDERIMGGTLNKSFLYKVIKEIEIKLLKKADHVIVLTDAAKISLNSFGVNDINNRVSSIPCCVNERFRFSSEERNKVRSELGVSSRFIVLHAGSLEKWYRIDKMMECFAHIKKIRKNALFLILSSMDKTSLDPAMKASCLSWNSVKIATVNFSEMPSYISAADMGLFFLKTSPAAAGFSPVKLGEYISCYLPILSNTNIGDMDKLFSSYKVGSLISEYTDVSYKTAFNKILSLKEDSKAFKWQCDQAIQNELSLKMGVHRYSNIYNKMGQL